MVDARKMSNNGDLQQDLSPGTKGELSVENLRKQADSLIENISAFRQAIARIAALEEENQELREALKSAINGD